MAVASIRGVNCSIWSHLIRMGYLDGKPIFLYHRDIT